ncbi:MAG: MMPL family transporter [Deltaproteobacteria bacterium]|nr:MMPL family transporter [Deltaproteobacteria bacterium]
MKQLVDDALARWLSRWVDGVRVRARGIVVVSLLLTAGFALYTARHLGINSDNLSLISSDLPSRQAHLKFIEHFPNLEEALFVVVDGRTPELTRSASRQLAERLRQEPELFSEVYLPGGGDFFEEKGLLYSSVEELDDFADQMARIQPFIGELEPDPSIERMADLIHQGLEERDETGADTVQWTLVLDRVGEATVAIYEEFPLAVSWEALLLEGSSQEPSTRQTLVAHPILDYSDILLGREPIERIRSISRELGLVPERGVTVRITGNPALNTEEMIALAWDIGGAGAFCFFFVALVLYRALRCVPLVVAALVTLLVGLIWTGAFTAVAIGHLNLASITFGILFIGLGVDFGIHMGMRYAELLRRGLPQPEALRETASSVGGALFFCTLTTAVSFYVFMFTDFRGLAELGAIAGTGMFIIFFLTLTLLPALVSSWLRVDPERHLGKTLHFDPRRLRWFAARPGTVRWASLAVGLLCIALLPGLRFDPNVVEMRDPSSESVQAFKDLLGSQSSPWFLNVLVGDQKEAAHIAEQVEALPEVDFALTLASYVPEEQQEKLEILADIAFFLEEPILEKPQGGSAASPGSADVRMTALRDLYEYLDTSGLAAGDDALAAGVGQLRDRLGVFLERIVREGRSQEALDEFEVLLLSSLPDQLARLRRALAASEIQLSTLPPSLRRQMRTDEGIARVQVFPSADMSVLEDLEDFVVAVQGVAPGAAGVPVNLVEFGVVTVSSFRQALVSAVLLISLLLWALWRDFSDVLLVMLPLCLGAALTAATMALFGIAFGFANVIVIPLLFGIGVDSAIHLVQNSKEGRTREDGLLGTSTARAVYYSALTSIVSFGSLACSGHNGMHNLGVTLTIGLVYTVVCVFVVLPALLDLHERGERMPQQAEGFMK